MFQFKLVCLTLLLIHQIKAAPQHNYLRDEAPEEAPKTKPKLLSSDQTFNAKFGETVQLPCEIEDLNKFTRFWKKANAPLFVNEKRVGKSHSYQVTSDGTLIISNASQIDAGEYTCSIPKTDLEVKYTLQVHEPSKDENVPPKDVIHVIKGQEIRLSCIASTSSDETIRWEKLDDTLNGGTESAITKEIVIPSAQRTDAGVYKCTATDSSGASRTHLLKVEVEYAPEIEVQNGVVHAGRNMRVILTCKIHANPKAEVFWKSNHGNIIQKMVNVNGLADVDVMVEGEENYGEYTCTAMNKHGSAIEKVVITGLPDQPTIVNSGSNLNAHDNKYEVKFHVKSYLPLHKIFFKYRSSQDLSTYTDWTEKQIDPSNDQPGPEYEFSHTMDNLESANYEVKIMVENEFGLSESSDTFSFSNKKEALGLATMAGAGVITRPYYYPTLVSVLVSFCLLRIFL